MQKACRTRKSFPLHSVHLALRAGSVPNKCWPMMTPGTQVTVTYHVKAVNADTGESVCSRSVPVGTKLRFEFVPHAPEDVVWNATGYSLGTPYGSWAVNGDYIQWDNGSKNICTPGNWYDTTVNAHYTDGTNIFLYADLAVATPEKNIALDGTGLDCNAADANGNRLCTAARSGNADALFTFHSTYGYFYGRRIIAKQPSPPTAPTACTVDFDYNAPMRQNSRVLTDSNQTVTWENCASNSTYKVVVSEKPSRVPSP